MEPSTLRRSLRAVFPDHCAVWCYGLGDEGTTGDAVALRRHAMHLMLKYDRNLAVRNPFEKFCRIVGTLAWPLNALIRAAAATLAIRNQLPEPAARQPFRVFLQCWNCALRHNIAPKAFFKFRLFLDANRARVRYYLQDHEMAYLVRAAWKKLDHKLTHTVNDKLEFFQFCQVNGVATVPVLAYCIDGKEITAQTPVEQLTGDLMLKYTNSASGEGVEMVAWNDATRDWRYNDQTIPTQRLAEVLRQKSVGRTAILQTKLMNHPDIKPLTGRGLSTVRMLTAVEPGDAGVPRVAAAGLRMSLGASVVDNMSAGGIASPINIENGTLDSAVGKDIFKGWVNRHPDSGAKIGDAMLPFWYETCELCARTHALVKGIPTIGWDVAILADGPILIEANLGWDAELVQLLGKTALGETLAASALRHCLTPATH